MAELKTKKTTASVEDFLNAIENEQRRRDCFVILKIMRTAFRKEPAMWGKSLVGFGDYHYKYASGHEGNWFAIGFSPRRSSISLHLMGALQIHKHLFYKLGKFKTGVGCVYINKLDDVDIKVLQTIIHEHVKWCKSLRMK
ncbi:MAG: DUF1801 domain-containing protein [Bacteroidia bacterium]